MQTVQLRRALLLDRLEERLARVTTEPAREGVNRAPPVEDVGSGLTGVCPRP